MDAIQYENLLRETIGEYGCPAIFNTAVFFALTKGRNLKYNWASDQLFETLDDGSTIMTFSSNQYYPVLDWVLEKGRFVKPIEHQKLVDDWKENAIEMAKMAEEM